MSTVRDLLDQASKFKALLSNADESEIRDHADELLLFLNRLQDFLRRSLKAPISNLSIDDIIYGLESNPEVTLYDKSVRTRLLNLFIKLSLH